MAIYYLEVDDEITSAAARIRGSTEQRIALVLPDGSRVATSRINFKLLEREAKQRNKQLSIVAPDASVRSLAHSAGMPVYATVREYEAAEAARPQDIGPDVSGEVSEALGELAATVGPSAPGPRSGRRGGLRDGSQALGSSGPDDAGGPPPRRRRRLGVSSVLLICLLAIIVAVGAYGAYVFWPSATIVLTVHEKPLGPLALTVKIDPSVVAVNDLTLTVPGMSKSFEVKQNGTFEATGQYVFETAATGTVTFSSINTVNSVTVPTGTTLSTADGNSFVTTARVIVPVATVSADLRLTPGTADASVQAVRKGTAGNVGANRIVRLPAGLASAKVGVTNQRQTTGGTHVVTPVVQQADLDTAAASLTKSLGDSFAAMLSDPGALPAGVQLFAETGRLGPIVFDPDPATLLDRQVGSFALAAKTTGTVTEADTGNVRGLAERQITGRVRSGYTLVEGSLTTAMGSPTPQGTAVSVPITATAFEAAIVDVDVLKAQIEGKSVEEARAYLSQFGDVTISVSPWWASNVSQYDFRIDLTVVAPTPHPSAGPGTAGPSVSGGASASASASSSGGASGSPAMTPWPGSSSSGGPSPSAS